MPELRPRRAVRPRPSALSVRPAFLALLPLLALALTAFLAGCRGGGTIVDEPGQFTFRGQPVHPAALAALYRSTTGTIDLASFKTSMEIREWEAQPGWWIAEDEPDPVSLKAPFFAYAAFAGPPAEGAELYVVSITFDTGDTGDVDNLLLVQKSGSWLGLIRAWNEGSACNGGIIAQRLEGDKFLYSRELTPVDLLELAPTVRLDLTPHEDLEATIESCFAAANYVYDIVQDREELVSIRLYDEPKTDEKGRTDRLRHQSCFNRLFNAYLSEGRKALSPKDLDEFAARFRDECLVPRASAAAAGSDPASTIR